MKLPVDKKRTIITFIIVDIIFALLLFVSALDMFLDSVWGFGQFGVIALFVVISVLMLVLSLTRNFYVIEPKFLVVVKGRKELYYYYNDIIFIDHERTKRKKILTFVTSKGHVRYLPFDRDGKIYEACLDKCNNLVDEEELLRRFPKISI